jgi:hypothetical protein
MEIKRISKYIFKIICKWESKAIRPMYIYEITGEQKGKPRTV